MKAKTVMGSLGAAMAIGSCALLVGAATASPSMKKMYKKKATKAIKVTLVKKARKAKMASPVRSTK